MADDPVVTQAISAVRERYTSVEWAALLPSEITAEIYQEIRRLDSQRSTISRAVQQRIAESVA